MHSSTRKPERCCHRSCSCSSALSTGGLPAWCTYSVACLSDSNGRDRRQVQQDPGAEPRPLKHKTTPQVAPEPGGGGRGCVCAAGQQRGPAPGATHLGHGHQLPGHHGTSGSLVEEHGMGFRCWSAGWSHGSALPTRSIPRFHLPPPNCALCAGRAELRQQLPTACAHRRSHPTLWSW